VAQPLVQAGEEILFIVDNGQITMHIRMRYNGPASRFGWLLPLPAPPTNGAGAQGIDVGTDELFDELEARTAPYTILTRIPGFPSSRFGCGGNDTFSTGYESVAVSPDRAMAISSPLVQQSSVGPYDYAILKADDKSAMLSWLVSNNYVVPAGSDDAISQ